MGRACVYRLFLNHFQAPEAYRGLRQPVLLLDIRKAHGWEKARILSSTLMSTAQPLHCPEPFQ